MITPETTDIGIPLSRSAAGADAGMQARLVRILEATTDYVAISTPDGALTYLNRAGREAAGFGFDAPLADANLAQLHPAWAYEIVRQEGIPTALSESVWRGETAFLRSDGREVPVSQLILSHTGHDGIEFISTIMRDISDRKREEVTRIEWTNRYDAAIRASGQLLFDWDSLTHEVTYAGNTEQILGYSMNELRGGLDRFRQFIHPDDLGAFDDEIQRVAITRDPFFAEFRVCRKDGRYVFIQAKGYFFLDREGRLSRMIGFFADTTEQRHAQEEIASAHDLLEARVEERTAQLAHAYAVIQDRAMQQEAVAQLGQRALAGADLAVLLGETAALVRSILKVDYCSVLELDEEGIEFTVRASAGWPSDINDLRVPASNHSQSGFTLITGEPVIAENLLTETRFEITETLRRHHITSSVSVMIAAGEQPMGVLIAFNRSPRKFTQDNVYFLQSVANVLTAAISRQRAEESVRLASEQAEKANRAKSEFLSRMSHELRTPLNAILGFTQLLELEISTPSQAESIEHISRAGRHLLSLINEVLDIARVEAGRLDIHKEAIPISGFLHDTVELIRPLARRNKINLSVEETGEAPDWHVLGDRQRLKQVLLNLLSNAVKYNRPQGSVTVRAAVAPNSRLRISVTDTGYGIAPEKIGRLFLPFERLGAESTEIEGTGIGLALSRGIVDALDGELGVESVEGLGSTFWVEIPISEVPPEITAPAASAPLPVETPGQTSTLLYIEDQDLNLRLVERILLHRPEYKLLSAVSGAVGGQIAREQRPDLILLDLNLPDISGEEVLAHLKGDPATAQIPVIMVSADAMGSRIDQLLEAGAANYLTKPYRVSEFLRVIQETLQNRKKAGEAPG